MRLRRRQASTVERPEPIPEQARDAPTRPVRRTRRWYGFGGKSVPKMTDAEIRHAYARREAEHARAQAELQAEFERTRAEREAGIQPPSSSGGWNPPGAGDLMDYEF
jgi:hypothetical protein